MARRKFNIPERYVPMAVISIGYQLKEDEIPEGIKEREHNDRVRNIIEENFFEGEWQKPIETL